jgi:hypothetical protein
VFSVECALATSASICNHADSFYPKRFEEPTIFWAFNSQEELPKHAIITQKTSEGGDLCHHKITGLSIKEAKKIIYAVPIDKCSICDGGHMRQLTSEDLTS